MKIRTETRWLFYFLLFFGSASLLSSLWVVREREKAQQAFREREDSLLRSIASLKSELSEAKVKGMELENKLQELSVILDRRSREVEELKTKYALAFKDKKTLEKQLVKSREEKVSLEEKMKQLYASPFLVKLLSEKKGFEADVEDLKQTIEKSRDELVQITEARNALESRIEEIQTAKVKIEEKLRQEQSKIETMSSDLAKEKESRLSVAESLSENFARVKREKEALQVELSRVSQEKIELEQEMDQVRDRLQEINEKRDELASQVRSIHQVLETRLREINQIRDVYEKAIGESRQIATVEREVVELPPIVVKGETPDVGGGSAEASAVAPPPAASQRQQEALSQVKNGKIVAVNAHYHFVVINLGEEDGIEEGMRFHVFRDGQEMGEVKVTEVRQKISACDIVPLENTLPFQEGDLVIY